MRDAINLRNEGRFLRRREGEKIGAGARPLRQGRQRAVLDLAHDLTNRDNFTLCNQTVKVVPKRRENRSEKVAEQHGERPIIEHIAHAAVPRRNFSSIAGMFLGFTSRYWASWLSVMRF